jgi:carbon-monoxide dehydrogenase large subunit
MEQRPAEDFAQSHGFDEIIGGDESRPQDSVIALKAEVIGDVGAYSIYPWTAALEPVQVVSFMPGRTRFRIIAGVRAVARYHRSYRGSDGRSLPSSPSV